MYLVDSTENVLLMLNELSANANEISEEIVNFIVQNEKIIFQYGIMKKHRFSVLFWKLSKFDPSENLINLAIGWNLHQPFLGATWEKLLKIGLKNPEGSLLKGIIKVTYFWLTFISLIQISQGNALENTKVTIKKDFLILNTEIPTSEIIQISETFNLMPLELFITEINKALKNLEILRNYKASRKPCSEEFYSMDDIYKISKEAKNLGLNSIRINHLEPQGNRKYVLALFLDNLNQYKCMITYSSDYAKILNLDNNFRIKPELSQVVKYHNFLNLKFRNVNNKTCLRHGLLPLKYYHEIFKVSKPSLETCSQICEAQQRQYRNYQMMSELTNFKLNNRPCLAYSFAISNNTCYISYTMTERNFMHDLDFKNEYKRDIVTAEPDCKSILDNGEIFVLINGTKIDAKTICSFSAASFADNLLNTKCLEQFYKVTRPLNEIRNQAIYFKDAFLKLHIINQKKKRSLTVLKSIFTVLQRGALLSGKSIVKNLLSGRGQSAINLLTKTANLLKNSGFERQIYKSSEEIKQIPLYNYTEIAINFKQLYKLINDSSVLNIYQVISRLQFDFNELKKYFTSLISNGYPVREDILNLIQNKSYIFSSYIDTKKLYRHFFITKENDKFKAKQISVIPISLEYYENIYLYQNDIFSHDKIMNNKCLIYILNDKIENNKILDTFCNEKNPQFKQLGKNILTLSHNLGQMKGEIFIVQGKAIIEVYCSLKTNLYFSTHLIIFLAGMDCNIKVNKIFIQNKIDVSNIFEQRVLFQFNETRNLALSEEFLQNHNFYFILITIILVLLGISTILVYFCYIKKKDQIQNNSYFKIETSEMSAINQVNENDQTESLSTRSNLSRQITKV